MTGYPAQRFSSQHPKVLPKRYQKINISSSAQPSYLLPFLQPHPSQGQLSWRQASCRFLCAEQTSASQPYQSLLLHIVTSEQQDAYAGNPPLSVPGGTFCHTRHRPDRHDDGLGTLLRLCPRRISHRTRRSDMWSPESGDRSAPPGSEPSPLQCMVAAIR